MDVVEDTGCPEDWPDALKEMRTLDNLLRCPICCELINTAMLVPKCSHTYCSLCIRRYSCFKSQCPTCSMAVSEPELLNNRLVDEIVSLFQQVRPVLLEVIKDAVKTGVNVSEIRKTKSTKVAPSASVSDSRESLWTNIQSKDTSESKQKALATSKETGRPFAIFSPRSSTSSTKRKFDICEYDDDFEDDVVICDGPAESKKMRTDESESLLAEPHTPSVKNHRRSVGNSSTTPLAGSSSSSSTVMSPGSVSTPTGRKAMDFQSPPYGTKSPLASSLASQTPSSSKTVPCPVCQADVPERNINIHLDRCLSGSEKKEGLRSSGNSRRKLLPKLVYNLIKDSELRKKLGAVGLPTTGDRQTMIGRHKEFTLIYNSECDSLNPRTAEEIVRDMMKGEQSKLKQATINPVSSLQIKKGASSDEVEKAQKDYVKKHQSQFAQLIAQAKKRMKGKEEKSSSSPAAEVSEVQPSSSVETETDTGAPSSVSSQDCGDSTPALPLQDSSSTIALSDESSHGSSELFCDQANPQESKDSVQNQVPPENIVDCNQVDDDSNCSDQSESLLLSQVGPKSLESKRLVGDTDPFVSKITPVDLNDPISVSSPGISTDVLSQISDSNDIPLTQASKSSRNGDKKGSRPSEMEDKLLENASQGSGVSIASSDSSRLIDGDHSDYAPDPDELHDSDNEIPKTKTRPKRKVQSKKKTAVSTPGNKSRRKGGSFPKSSVPGNTPSPSENIDINNLVDDPDFVAKPPRRLRTRKGKT